MVITGVIALQVWTTRFGYSTVKYTVPGGTKHDKRWNRATTQGAALDPSVTGACTSQFGSYRLPNRIL